MYNRKGEYIGQFVLGFGIFLTILFWLCALGLAVTIYNKKKTESNTRGLDIQSDETRSLDIQSDEEDEDDDEEHDSGSDNKCC